MHLFLNGAMGLKDFGWCDHHEVSLHKNAKRGIPLFQPTRFKHGRRAHDCDTRLQRHNRLSRLWQVNIHKNLHGSQACFESLVCLIMKQVPRLNMEMREGRLPARRIKLLDATLLASLGSSSAFMISECDSARMAMTRVRCKASSSLVVSLLPTSTTRVDARQAPQGYMQ